MNSKTILAAAAAILALCGTPATASDAQDLVLTGDKVCTKCHDESDNPQQLAVGKTKHGTVADKKTPTCQSCHGESRPHIDNPGGKRPRPPVDVLFKQAPGSGTPASAPSERNDKCISCHQGGKRMNWASGAHATSEVACNSCHKVHAQNDTVRDKTSQADVCYTCHKEQRSQGKRPHRHPVPEGKVTCSSCHNPHGDNPKMLVQPSVNETCYLCHTEKRGPFVHNHQPVVEDCSICHSVHGSAIAGMLKARPPVLCQDCHSHTSHPSQAIALPSGRTTSSSLLGSSARGCLNCHTNIHGGNSTQNSATAGRFRR